MSSFLSGSTAQEPWIEAAVVQSLQSRRDATTTTSGTTLTTTRMPLQEEAVVAQIIEMEKVKGSSNADSDTLTTTTGRWLLRLSDGTHFIRGVLSSSAQLELERQHASSGCLVCLQKWLVMTQQQAWQQEQQQGGLPPTDEAAPRSIRRGLPNNDKKKDSLCLYIRKVTVWGGHGFGTVKNPLSVELCTRVKQCMLEFQHDWNQVRWHLQGSLPSPNPQKRRRRTLASPDPPGSPPLVVAADTREERSPRTTTTTNNKPTGSRSSSSTVHMGDISKVFQSPSLLQAISNHVVSAKRKLAPALHAPSEPPPSKETTRLRVGGGNDRSTHHPGVDRDTTNPKGARLQTNAAATCATIQRPVVSNLDATVRDHTTRRIPNPYKKPNNTKVHNQALSKGPTLETVQPEASSNNNNHHVVDRISMLETEQPESGGEKEEEDDDDMGIESMLVSQPPEVLPRDAMTSSPKDSGESNPEKELSVNTTKAQREQRPGQQVDDNEEDDDSDFGFMDVAAPGRKRKYSLMEDPSTTKPTESEEVNSPAAPLDTQALVLESAALDPYTQESTTSDGANPFETQPSTLANAPGTSRSEPQSPTDDKENAAQPIALEDANDKEIEVAYKEAEKTSPTVMKRQKMVSIDANPRLMVTLPLLLESRQAPPVPPPSQPRAIQDTAIVAGTSTRTSTANTSSNDRWATETSSIHSRSPPRVSTEGHSKPPPNPMENHPLSLIERTLARLIEECPMQSVVSSSLKPRDFLYAISAEE